MADPDRTVIVIDDDSETEGAVEAQLLQGSPRGSTASGQLPARGTQEFVSQRGYLDGGAYSGDTKLDHDPPRTPTTNGPTSASVSPTPGHRMTVTPSGTSGRPANTAPVGADAMMMDLHHPPADISQKPKSTQAPKHAKADSPPPQLPVRPPPQPTVRLEFFIDDPEQYEVDVLALAKGTGQRLPTPPPPEKDSSDSDDDDEPPEPPAQVVAGLDGVEPGAAPKRRRRRNRDYDLDDPFIDDVDLAIDERTHFAQTTLQGFYVSAGDVALVEQSTPPPSHYTGGNAYGNPNNPNNTFGGPNGGLSSTKRGPGRPPKRASGPLSATLIARTLLSYPLGDKHHDDVRAQAAIAASMDLGAGIGLGIDPHEQTATPPFGTGDADGTNGNGHKRKREASPPADGADPKRRKLGATGSFHPELQVAIENLQAAIKKHDFAIKGKFPPDLKPILTDVAIQAITVGDYNDNFFNLLPTIFPYNRFTMMKLTKRLVYKDHVRLVHERQNVLLEELKKLVDEGFENAESEYHRNVAMWEEKKARRKTEGGVGMEGVEHTGPAAPTQAPVAAPDIDHEGDDEGDDDKDKAPGQRYRLNEAMRGYLWALVQLSNEVCTLTNDKNFLEGSKEVVSEQSQRKELYKKVLQAFPDGWMNTGTISREVSMMKKKMETAAAPALKPEEQGAGPAAPAT